MRITIYESSISTACPAMLEQELDRPQKSTLILTLCPGGLPPTVSCGHILELNQAADEPLGGLQRPQACVHLGGCRGLTACTPSPVQAGLSSAADKEQEAYRRYLLQRLIPAMAAELAEVQLWRNFDPANIPERDMKHWERLAGRTPTAYLESRLAEYYTGLLEVRANPM